MEATADSKTVSLSLNLASAKAISMEDLETSNIPLKSARAESKMEGDGQAFEQHLKQLTQVEFASIDPSGAFKDRLSVVETVFQSQVSYNNLVTETLADGHQNIINLEVSVEAAVAAAGSLHKASIISFRQEFQHKFELQMAENRRLQAGVASLKVETAKTLSKLVLVTKKLQDLSKEFGIIPGPEGGTIHEDDDE